MIGLSNDEKNFGTFLLASMVKSRSVRSSFTPAYIPTKNRPNKIKLIIRETGETGGSCISLITYFTD